MVTMFETSSCEKVCTVIQFSEAKNMFYTSKFTTGGQTSMVMMAVVGPKHQRQTLQNEWWN
jgi:hypothetical protein